MVYNYKKLLSGDVDLQNLIDNGTNLYFDCPPMFGGNNVKQLKQEDYQYYREIKPNEKIIK